MEHNHTVLEHKHTNRSHRWNKITQLWKKFLNLNITLQTGTYLLEQSHKAQVGDDVNIVTMYNCNIQVNAIHVSTLSQRTGL